MSDVIDFLERFGGTARLPGVPQPRLEEALATAGIETALHGPILAGDAGALERALGAATGLCCLIRTPDDDEDDADEDDDEDFDDDDENDTERKALRS